MSASLTGSANFTTYREADGQGFRRRVSPLRRFQNLSSGVSVRSVGATRSVWARETAGVSPAALTNFKMLPSSNTSGIRLLSGTMQVGILSAAPLPGGVKVAQRPVKPFGVGASPTLAANLEGRQI